MPKKGSVFGAPPAAVVDEGEEQLTLDELGNALGPVKDLPPIVRRRVDALSNLHKQYLGVQKQFQAELADLERKYQKIYEPIQDKREQIVNGAYEPTDEEAKVEKKEGEEEEEEEGKKREAKPEDANIKGIPQYWLMVLQNNIHIAQTIYENDEDALAFLKDIRSAELEGEEQGFTITFHFAENPFFTNTTLTKVYYLTSEDEYFGEPMLERVTGTKINWKPGKNLTVTQVKKKIKAKGKKPAKVITVDEPAPSFFTFFTPPQLSADDEEPDPDAEDALEADFDLGCIIKEKLIPYSVLWFTGEAARFEDEYDDFDGEIEDEDEGEEDTDEDDEDEEEEPPKKGRRVPGGPGHSFAPPPGAARGGAGAPAQPQQPECKQQ